MTGRVSLYDAASGAGGTRRRELAQLVVVCDTFFTAASDRWPDSSLLVAATNHP
jgi:hypothetical protein